MASICRPGSSFKEDRMFRHSLPALVVVSLLAASPHASAAQTATRVVAKSSPAAGVVNINTASASDLEALPGIGAKTAARIVEYRQKNGPFKKIEEILESSRSCPYSLSVFAFGVRRSVSRSRQKSQQISR